MFTCSSCGYEANPDSSPACSLCGTKRPVKPGAKVDEPAPKPVPAPAAASASSSASSGSSASSSSSSAAKSETRKPAKKTDDMDELASAAQAVADSATVDAPVTSRGARGGRPAAGEGKAVVTTTGILRMSAAAPPIDNALTLMGAFAGSLMGYTIEWVRLGAAPSAFGHFVLPTIVGIVLALIARFVVAPSLEESLNYKSKVTVHGPVAGVTGAALAVFAIVGFVAASRAAPANSAQTSNAALDGVQVAQRLALVTPWTITFKTDKVVVLGLKGKPELHLPCAALGAEDVASVLKATGLARADLDRLLGPDPLPILPPEFSADVFLDRLGSVYSVLKDSPRPKEQRSGRLLLRRRRNGQDELLSLPNTVKAPGDLQSALPQGVPSWIGVSLGIPHDSTSDHDALVGAAYDQYRPTD